MGVFDLFRRKDGHGSEKDLPSGLPSMRGAEQPPISEQADDDDDGFTEFGPSQFGDSLAGPLSVQSAQEDDAGRDGQRERRVRHRVNARPGTRVLIIDDSAAVISGLRRLMRQNQLDPIEAIGGERGLELAFSEQPELIFLAVAMPGLSGYNTLRALRRDERTREVPVIMMSANTQGTEADYVRRIGADDFVTKPFSRGDVFRRIERLLDPALVPRRPTEPGALA